MLIDQIIMGREGVVVGWAEFTPIRKIFSIEFRYEVILKNR